MMKRLLTFLLALSLVSWHCVAAPTWVQNQLDANVVSANPVNCSFLHAWTAGHGLVGEYYDEEGTASFRVTSITDDAGNTYSILAHIADIGSTTNFVVLFGLANVAGSPTVLHVNYSATPTGTNEFCWADEVASAGAIDKFVQGSNSSNTMTPTSGNVTTTANDLVWAVYSPSTAAGTVSAGSGYTLRLNDAVTGGFSESQAQAAAGTIAATFSQTTAGTSVVNLIALSPASCAGQLALAGVGC